MSRGEVVTLAVDVTFSGDYYLRDERAGVAAGWIESAFVDRDDVVAVEVADVTEVRQDRHKGRRMTPEEERARGVVEDLIRAHGDEVDLLTLHEWADAREVDRTLLRAVFQAAEVTVSWDV